MESGPDSTQLRSIGVLATGPRREVLSALRARSAPASAIDIYADLRAAGVRISLTTVYRVLQLFAGHHLVHSFAGTEQRYRLCARTPHAHLVCEHCQAVFERPVGTLVRWLSGSEAEEFDIDLEHTTVYGTCGKCRSPGRRRAVGDSATTGAP